MCNYAQFSFIESGTLSCANREGSIRRRVPVLAGTEYPIVARFKVGDCVRRESTPDPKYVTLGTINAVIPNQHGLELFDEYEVDFGVAGILIAYDAQLKAAR